MIVIKTTKVYLLKCQTTSLRRFKKINRLHVRVFSRNFAFKTVSFKRREGLLKFNNILVANEAYGMTLMGLIKTLNVSVLLLDAIWNVEVKHGRKGRKDGRE